MSKVASAFLHLTGTNPQEGRPPPPCEEAGMFSSLGLGVQSPSFLHGAFCTGALHSGLYSSMLVETTGPVLTVLPYVTGWRPGPCHHIQNQTINPTFYFD